MPGTNLTRDEAAAAGPLLDVTGLRGRRSTSPRVTRPSGIDDDRPVHGDEPGASTFVDLIADDVHEVVLNGRALARSTRSCPPGGSRCPAWRPRTSCASSPTAPTCTPARVCTGSSTRSTGRSTSTASSRSPTHAGCSPASTSPTSRRPLTLTVTAPAHWTGRRRLPHPGARAGRRRQPRPGASRPRRRLSPYVQAVVAGPVPRRARRADQPRRPRRSRSACSAAARWPSTWTPTRSWTSPVQGFAYFEELFDLAYPFAKYDQLFVPEFNAGAMENAGAVTITEHYVFRSKVPAGDGRAPGADDPARARPHVVRRPGDDALVGRPVAQRVVRRVRLAPAARPRPPAGAPPGRRSRSAEKSWAYRQDQLATTHPVVADIRDLEDVEVNFDGITYAKGASVLKQLVHWVGTGRVRRGAAPLLPRRTRGATPRCADLLAELEATSGRDLDEWAAAVAAAGRRHHAAPADRDRRRTAPIAALAVVQEAPAEHPVLRPHRLAVGGYDLVDGRLRRTQRARARRRRRRAPRCRSWSARRGRRCCSSTTTTSRTRRSGSTRRSLATAVAHLRRLRGLAAAHARLGRRVGHDARRRARRPRVRRPRARQPRLGRRPERRADAAAPARAARWPSTSRPSTARRRAAGRRRPRCCGLLEAARRRAATRSCCSPGRSPRTPSRRSRPASLAALLDGRAARSRACAVDTEMRWSAADRARRGRRGAARHEIAARARAGRHRERAGARRRRAGRRSPPRRPRPRPGSSSSSRASCRTRCRRP